jgi:hypothetical protein
MHGKSRLTRTSQRLYKLSTSLQFYSQKSVSDGWLCTCPPKEERPPLLAVGLLSVHRCKPLPLLSCTVMLWRSVRLDVLIFYKRGEKILKFFSGWKRWKLFCKLWSVRCFVRLANVLTPVRWLFVIVFVINYFLQIVRVE